MSDIMVCDICEKRLYVDYLLYEVTAHTTGVTGLEIEIPEHRRHFCESCAQEIENRIEELSAQADYRKLLI